MTTMKSSSKKPATPSTMQSALTAKVPSGSISKAASIRDEATPTETKKPINRNLYETVESAPTEPKKPTNRNLYETVESGPKKPISRNLYESVGNVPPVPDDAPGPCKAINRNAYEQVQTGPGEEAGKLTDLKPAFGEKIDLAPGPIIEETTLPPSFFERRKRRRRRAEEEKLLTGTTRLVVVGCSLVVVVILIATVLGLGVHFIQEGREEYRRTEEIASKVLRVVGNISRADYGYDSCKPYGDVGWKLDECVVFSPANQDDAECQQVMCEVHLFNGVQIDRVWTPKKHYKLPKPNATDPILCKERIKPDERRVCVKNQEKKTFLCDHKYVGPAKLHTDHELEKQNQWEDNCDQPSSCWTVVPPDIEKSKIHKREACFDKTDNCPDDNLTAAIVYMQHLYCDIDVDGVGKFCEGEPYRVWECRHCTNNFPVYKNRYANSEVNRVKLCDSEKAFKLLGTCTYTCEDEPMQMRRKLPNGAPCRLDAASIAVDQRDYCVEGDCVRITNENYRTNSATGKPKTSIDTVDECARKKKERKQNKTSIFPHRRGLAK